MIQVQKISESFMNHVFADIYATAQLYTHRGPTMNQRELHIMKQLRNNARESLTRMSRKTGIPVSTIYERLKQFEGDVITKHTCLINFSSLGYDLRLTVLVKAKSALKERLEQFLRTHHRVNTILRINNGFDFIAEVVFKNMAEVHHFLEELDENGCKQKKEYYVLEELIREGFLTAPAHVDLFDA